MAKDYRIKVDPNKIKVRDELIKDMITSVGGTARVFVDRRKKAKQIRKQKHKKSLDT